MISKILIISGSDSSGGAGMQADIKTANKLKTYCASVISCLTAQDSQKVHQIFYLPAKFIVAQVEAVLNDIKIDAIKIGMVGNIAIIEAVAQILEVKAPNTIIVTDPVMVSTGGDYLLQQYAEKFLAKRLIANSYLTTPNIPEAEMLAEMKINDLSEVKIAAARIRKIGVKNVLIKGGHLNSGNRITNYLLKEDGQDKLFSSKKLNFGNVHGTGCTLATAITSFLSKNLDLELAIKKSNQFVYKAIKNGSKVGHGSRFLNHH